MEIADLFAPAEKKEARHSLSFGEFWAAYPKRLGANPRAMAEKKFNAAVKSGVDPERIINSVKAYGDELRAQRKFGTEFVAQAITWLNQRRYEDYAPDPGNAARDARIKAEMAGRGYFWVDGKWQKIGSK